VIASNTIIMHHKCGIIQSIQAYSFMCAEQFFAKPGPVKVLTTPIDGFHMSADKQRFRSLSNNVAAVAALQTADQTAFWVNCYIQIMCLAQALTLQKWRMLPASSALGSCCFIGAR